MTEQKKAKIVIEFQSWNEDDLKSAVCRLCMSVSSITGSLGVTATEYIPDKFNPYAKS